jgi:NADP-dependent aldehyde dehydrogenase
MPAAVAQRTEAIADGLAQSITLGVGQFCTKPGVVLGVRGEDLDRLTATLADRLGRVGAGVMLYGGLLDAYQTALERACARAVRVPVGGPAPDDPARAQPALLTVDVARFLDDAALREEVFGPASLMVVASDTTAFERVAETLEGQLTATIHGTDEELSAHSRLVAILQQKVGRLIFNGFPTGVEVGHAMQHGGPYPACTDARSTSVGTAAIGRFARPVCFQDFPDAALPPALRNRNAFGIWRLVDGAMTREDVVQRHR